MGASTLTSLVTLLKSSDCSAMVNQSCTYRGEQMDTKQLLIELDDEIEKLTYVRSLLTGSKGTELVSKRRIMSAAARKRIGDAQRKR